MTDKEKAKAYDEALKKASAAYKDEDKHLKATLERIFPELNESKDIKIRKEIISILRNAYWTSNRNRFNELVAWLEKQGKQKKQAHFPKFTFDDVLALQCCMETVKKVQEDKELYEKLNLIHSKMYDAYWLEKQDEQASLQNNKNIDLTKILEDCPKGWKFYSDKYGEVTFWGFSDLVYPIQLNTKNHGVKLLSEKGEEIIGNGKCILFPSKDQKDWNKFTAPWYKKDKLIKPKFKVGDWIITTENKVLQITNIEGTSYRFNNKSHYWEIYYCDEQCHLWTIEDAKDGDVLALSWLEDKNLFEKIIIFKKYYNKGVKGLYSMPCVEGYGKTFKNGKIAFTDEEVPYYSKTWAGNLHPATKEQRNLLFQKIKEAGYKWNDETKTLEKLIKPKFKVGDRIRHKVTNKGDVYEISKVYNNSYGIDGTPWMINMEYQDQYELVPNKFDPKTLKAFDKVLVSIDGEWQCDFFSHMLNGGIFNKRCIGVGDMNIVIPYNDDTKHLVGTTEEAPEYYRYQED